MPQTQTGATKAFQFQFADLPGRVKLGTAMVPHTDELDPSWMGA